MAVSKNGLCRAISLVAVLLGGLLTLGTPRALAEASGPDFFRVVGVEASDVLNIRAEASATAEKIGEIPSNGDGIRNLGCTGGMSFAEWEKATEAERAAAARTRWCRIEYRGVEGWVAGWYLGEGSAQKAALGTLWSILLIDGEAAAPEAELGFSQEGRVYGTVGCNRFQGGVEVRDSTLAASGPFAATRMACVDPAVERQETRILDLLASSLSLSYDPITDRLALLGADGTPAILLERKPR